MKSKMHALSAIVGICVLVAVTFQNCAKVTMSSVEEEIPTQTLNTPSDFSSVTVGTSDLADLKMLFVVDNSYSMQQSNINLAQSFSTLFNSQNSDNLTRFSVTSGLITVAQQNPEASLSNQTRLNQLSSWQIAPSVSDAIQLNNLRQGSSRGKLAGDSIGYSVQSKNGSFSFSPAMVLGVTIDGKVSGEISKGKSESPSAMVSEFKNRLSLLQNLPAENYDANSDILDKESGLCALARVLRSPSSFMKPGDLPVFGVFTDEDDSDVEGKRCLASYTYSEGNDNRIDGVCETRKTTLNYKISTPTAGSCKIYYDDTFKWSLTYNAKETIYALSYYKPDHYSCPQTQMDYKAVSKWQRKKTAISVTYKTFKVFDGTKVFDSQTQTKNLTPMNGEKASTECSTAAKAALNSASEQYVSNTCNVSQVDDSTCGFADSSCVVTEQIPKSVTITGDFTGSCATIIAQTDSKYISGTGTCKLTGSQASSTTAVTPTCSAVMNPTVVVVTDLTKDLSTQAKCEAEANSRGALVSATYPAKCTPGSRDVTPTKTGSLSLLSWTSVKAAGACPTDVKNQVISTSGVAAASVTECKIVSLNNTSVTQTLTAADCVTQANSYCATQTKGINCKLASSTLPSTTSTDKALAADEELTCTAKCRDSKTGFCKPTATLATVNPDMSIADYLVQAQQAIVGSCTAPAAVVSGQVDSYNAQLESEKASLCAVKTSAGLPIYNRVTKAAYHINGFAPDYIAGNKTASDGKSLEPKVDLPTYIFQRSQELFGQQLPIVNVFVRKAGDPLGETGSRGLAYERLATMMNGKVQSVLSPDYSSALQDLASIINSKISRSFKVPNMGTTQKVVSVSVKEKGTGVSRELASGEWSQSGQTIQVSPAVTLNLGDELRFEFK